MTDLEIAEIAMEFGDYDAKSQCYTFNGNGKFSILAFAAAIRAATKEEDAKICEDEIASWQRATMSCQDEKIALGMAAKSIRASK